MILDFLKIINICSFYIGWSCIIFGSFMIFTSAVGIIRMPDLFTKIHAASIGDSFGCPLILFGLILHMNDVYLGGKIFLLICLIFLISPISNYSLSQSAIIAGLKPLGESYKKSSVEINDDAI